MIIIAARHADKETVGDGTFDPDDPPLSKAGGERARLLGRMFKPAGVSVVFHSDARRTRETAEHVRAALGGDGGVRPDRVEVPFAGGTIPQQIDRTVAGVLARPAAATVLVVGHSNTVGRILQGLGAAPAVGDLDDEAFDDLFVLARSASGAATLVRMKYGEVTPPSAA